MSPTKTLIRNIYLYLATFVGLMMIAIPAGQLIKLGLQTWVFPLAAESQYQYTKVPLAPYVEKIGTETDLGTIKLTQAEKESLTAWQADYKAWQGKDKNIDWKKAGMQQEATDNLAILIVGIVVFLCHGYILKKDKKNET